MALNTYSCRFDRCYSKRRDGDIFCRRCYFKLPERLRKDLYAEDVKVLSGHIILCLTWLDSNTPHQELTSW